MLKIDLYTKTVLTVIAAALLWLCFRGSPSIPAAYGDAGSSVQDVRIVGIQKPASDSNWAPVNVFTVNSR